MESKKMAKQMLDSYKSTFDNSFSAMLTLQDQMQHMSSMFIEQTTALPEEGQKALTEWIMAYKKGCEEFKKAMDENFKRVESFLSEG